MLFIAFFSFLLGANEAYLLDTTKNGFAAICRWFFHFGVKVQLHLSQWHDNLSLTHNWYVCGNGAFSMKLIFRLSSLHVGCYAHILLDFWEFSQNCVIDHVCEVRIRW